MISHPSLPVFRQKLKSFLSLQARFILVCLYVYLCRGGTIGVESGGGGGGGGGGGHPDTYSY